MHIYTLDRWRHNHRFHRPDGRNERSTRRVMLLTIGMMVVEIAVNLRHAPVFHGHLFRVVRGVLRALGVAIGPGSVHAQGDIR